MPTSYYGGQGAPYRNRGKFTVRYSTTTAQGSRQSEEKLFTEYDQAEAFYNSIDDSAALWDDTGMPELCEAKTRIAYYSGILHKQRSKTTTMQVHTVADEPEDAARIFSGGLRGSGWKLLPDSVQELTEEEYEQLDPANHIEVVVPRR